MEVGIIQDKKHILEISKKWDIIPFSKIIKDISGGNTKVFSSEMLEYGSIPVVDQGKNKISGYTDNPNSAFKGELPIIVFGDHTRIIKYIDFNFAVGADGTKLLKVIDKNAYTKYIYYYLTSLNIINTGYNRHYKFIKDIVIPLPPLATQKHIADILDAADALRRKTQQIVDSYDELAQSLFLEMFGDTWTNPKKWDLNELSKIVKSNKIITYGIVQAGPDYPNGVPYIRTGDIKNGRILVSSLLKTASEIAQSYERSKCSSGDIIMSIRATVGTCAILPKELDGANLTQGTARISPNENIIKNIYLYHCICTKGTQLRINKETKGATFREITLERLRKVLIPIPPLSLQNQFAEKIALIEQQKELAKQSLTESENLFNALLQKAFKGELVPEPQPTEQAV